MDKELREKIALEVGSAIAVYVSNYRTQPFTFSKALRNKATNEILALIKEAGYRKVSGEPPVLSDEEIDRTIFSVIVNADKKGITHFPISMKFKAIAQVQRDADVRFYTT